MTSWFLLHDPCREIQKICLPQQALPTIVGLDLLPANLTEFVPALDRDRDPPFLSGQSGQEAWA
jgi:hypothetical protein